MTILGLGSNILIRDGGIDGVVIRLGTGFSFCKGLGKKILAGGFCVDKKLSCFAQERGIAGFEFLFGVPGTIAGALQTNAGCYNQQISNSFVMAKGVDFSGNTKKLSLTDLNFSYRSSCLPSDIIITSVLLKGEKDDPPSNSTADG